MNDKNKPKLRFPEFTDAWEQRKLGNDIESIQTGTNLLGSESKTGTPLLKMGNIQRGYFDLNKLEYLDESDTIEPENIAYYGDFFFNTRNTMELVGKGATWVGDSGIYAFNSNIARFKLRDIDTVFFNYLYNTEGVTKQIHARATGTTSVAAIYPRALETVEYFVPSLEEQSKIGELLIKLDNLITLHQRKCDSIKKYKKGCLQKMFPKDGADVPEIRFPGFTDAWEQRKLGEEFKRVNERNNGQFGITHWISVAKMYYQEPDKVQSNNLDTRTYVMRHGDIAFEGHPNSEFQFGRFVANDIGDGIISELFPIYRHIKPYDNQYWKYAIQIERIMRPVYSRAITSSGASSNKLNEEHFLRESIPVPSLEEQKRIGVFFTELDNLITLHQRKCDKYRELKKGLLQQMFI